MRLKLNILLFLALTYTAHGQRIQYPDTKQEPFKEELHGITVLDFYRWLENDRSEETGNWVKEQNRVTAEHLVIIPFRSQLKERMSSLWEYERHTAPRLEAGWYYYYKNDGRENHDVLFRRQAGKENEELVFNPNTLSDDGTASLRFFSVSTDGRLAAYGISRSGSDWTEIRLMDCSTKRELSETLTGVKFSSIGWFGDGFYYSRFDNVTDGGEAGSENVFQKIYYHKAGTPQSQDVLVYEDPKNPQKTYSARVSRDEKYLFISSARSSSGNDLAVRKTADNTQFTMIAEGNENSWSVIDTDKESILLLTNENAPKKRVVEYIFGQAQKKTIIAEREETLISVTRAGSKLIAHYMKDASSRLLVFSLKGNYENEITLPGFCTVNTVNGHPADSMLYFTISGFTSPGTIYSYNLLNKNQLVYYSPEIPGFNSSEYEVHQVFYHSKDSTKIPMFIVHRAGTVRNGNLPVLLYGYGGFNISKTPEFLLERIPFLEKGGVLALPNLRGGGEYGKDWHRAGTKLKKQNVFDDFIAAAEYLIREEYTVPEKIAIGGRSNGGLLVGAVMTQRPDLFRVALPAVGVMDMLRFHKFTIGWAWTGDFGSPDDPEEFKALYAYSPYHNLKKGINYPATLVTTGDHDDRVIPGHSYKFIAQLQNCHSGSEPVLIRIDENAGHGLGKPVSKIIDEQVDIFSFMMYHLGMTF